MANIATKLSAYGIYCLTAQETLIQENPNPASNEAIEAEPAQEVFPETTEQETVLDTQQVIQTLYIQPKISGMRV